MVTPAALISIAPMMGYTDAHFRHLMRLLHPDLYVYTEMLTCNQVLHCNWRQLLACDARQSPVALQLAGCCPEQLARATELAQNYNYQSINLNVGCPSPRLSAANYGACLFTQPELVAKCVHAMQQVSSVPITVKTRAGVDKQDSYADLHRFVEIVAASGCRDFIVHARKAWLKGLNPRQNRSVPKLHPERVYRLKQDFPQLNIIINGGITNAAQVQQHLAAVDGVMLGRVCYQDIHALQHIVATCLPTAAEHVALQQVEAEYWQYVFSQFAAGVQLRTLIKPLFGLYRAAPGARRKRQLLQNMVSSVDLQQLQTQAAALQTLYTPETL